jgi:hypothetical protein
LLAAGGAVALAFLATRPASIDGTPGRYLCPMHPAMTARSGGACPVCGMALVPAASHRPGDPVSAPPATLEVVRRRSFVQEVRAPARLGRDGVLQALLYADELALVTAGAVFRQSEGAPGREVVPGPGPPVRWDRSTWMVPFRLDGRAGPLAAGATGTVALEATPRQLLVVPYAAVLESPRGSTVLVTADNGRTVETRPVQLGRVFYDLAVVMSGLQEGETVVARDAFFLQAERAQGRTR